MLRVGKNERLQVSKAWQWCAELCHVRLRNFRISPWAKSMAGFMMNRFARGIDTRFIKVD